MTHKYMIAPGRKEPFNTSLSKENHGFTSLEKLTEWLVDVYLHYEKQDDITLYSPWVCPGIFAILPEPSSSEFLYAPLTRYWKLKPVAPIPYEQKIAIWHKAITKARIMNRLSGGSLFWDTLELTFEQLCLPADRMAFKKLEKEEENE